MVVGATYAEVVGEDGANTAGTGVVVGTTAAAAAGEVVETIIALLVEVDVLISRLCVCSANCPPFESVLIGLPFSSTQRVTGMSTVVYAVSVTIEVTSRGMFKGAAAEIAAKAETAKKILLKAIAADSLV